MKTRKNNYKQTNIMKKFIKNLLQKYKYIFFIISYN